MRGFKNILPLAALLLGLWAPVAQVGAQGTVCEPDPWNDSDRSAGNRMREHLKQRQFGAIAEELQDKIERYRKGQYSDWRLMRDMALAVDGNVAFEPLLQEWARQMPANPTVHVLKGLFHIEQGYARRGTAYSKDTSQEQFDAMAREMDQARASLRKALNLDPRLGVAHAALINIARTDSEMVQMLYGSPRKIYEEGLKADPMSMAVRLSALNAFHVKWSGDHDLTGVVLQHPSNSQLSAAQRNFLNYRVLMLWGDFHDNFSKFKREAIKSWHKAAEVCPWPDPLSLAANAQLDLEDWTGAIRDLERYAAIKGQTIYVLANRGRARQALGEFKGAAEDFQRAAQLGDAWSMHRLAMLLEKGEGVPKSPTKALALYRTAANNGHAPSRQALERLGAAGGKRD